jgi:hypothetical protein
MVSSTQHHASLGMPGLSRARDLIAVLFLAMATNCNVSQARAAGAAFAVDTSEISETGSCKVESWQSWASNRDKVSTANPACVVDIFRPVELSGQIARTRADDEWATSVTPKAKTKIVPTQIGNFGLAVAAGTSYDLTTSENASVFAYAPATLRLSEVVRINVNGGWLWDRTVDQHYLTYGIGLDWRLTDILTLTVETFGQVGGSEVSAVTQPRFQTGLRLRPIDRLSFDVIYGHNINGEGANWFTVATTIRFPPMK